MSNIGSRGHHAQNCHRDLLRHFGKTNPIPLPVEQVVPMKLPRSPTLPDQELPTDILYPHQVFSVVATNFPAMFSSWKGQQPLHQFWTDALDTGDPTLLNHPLCDRPDWKNKALPLT
eukprot:1282605-Alexandrium_andersonii.AAC.1